jgi:hypothetical protein
MLIVHDQLQRILENPERYEGTNAGHIAAWPSTLKGPFENAMIFELDPYVITTPMIEAALAAQEAGVFRMPAPTVWIEIKGIGVSTGILAIDYGYEPKVEDDAISLLPFIIYENNGPDSGIVGIGHGSCEILLHDGEPVNRFLDFPTSEMFEGIDEDKRREECTMMMQIAYAFFASLECRDVEVTCQGPSPRIKAKRAKRGLPPLVEYKKLVIKPHLKGVYQEASASCSSGGSKKFHFVRGHVRHLDHLEPGRKTFVSPHYRGDAHIGQVKKTYVVEGE